MNRVNEIYHKKPEIEDRTLLKKCINHIESTQSIRSQYSKAETPNTLSISLGLPTISLLLPNYSESTMNQTVRDSPKRKLPPMPILLDKIASSKSRALKKSPWKKMPSRESRKGKQKPEGSYLE